MSETRTIGIIRPEAVAHKLAAIRNYECPELLRQITVNPRLVEMLWFIQYASMQPGGLAKFAEELLNTLPHRIGTGTMIAAKGKPYTAAQRLAIRKELPLKYLRKFPGWQVEIALAGEDEAFLKICRAAAIDILPDFLSALCTDKAKGFDSNLSQRDSDEDLAESLESEAGENMMGLAVERRRYERATWFIDDPIAAVIEMMDRCAGEVSKRLAMTEVTKKVFDALDYAIQELAMVRIEGDSRFGKTESVRAWCDMRPGRARLVSVPSSNSLSDLHRRVAESLGMDVSYGSRAQRVKERIEFVLRHSGIFIVLDEAAFLVPQNYTPATAPARLNWVRTEIVDRGLPLAVIVTPQSFLPLVNRFIKKTGYAMEQFFGRNHRAVRLPAELSSEDMVAVARIHFPEMDDDYLALIADLAGMSENYLQAVEAISKLARYIARREGHRRITAADIEAAASEVIPRQPTAQSAAVATTEGCQSTRSGRVSRQPNAPLKGVSRGVKPIHGDRLAPVILASRSLRSAGSVKVESEPVSAET